MDCFVERIKIWFIVSLTVLEQKQQELHTGQYQEAYLLTWPTVIEMYNQYMGGVDLAD
jgi:hypothetical protein